MTSKLKNTVRDLTLVLPIHPSTHLSVYLTIPPSNYPSIQPSTHPYDRPSLPRSDCPSIHWDKRCLVGSEFGFGPGDLCLMTSLCITSCFLYFWIAMLNKRGWPIEYQLYGPEAHHGPTWKQPNGSNTIHVKPDYPFLFTLPYLHQPIREQLCNPPAGSSCRCVGEQSVNTNTVCCAGLTGMYSLSLISSQSAG